MRREHVPAAALAGRAKHPGQRLPIGQEQHLEVCARCRTDLARLRSLVDYLRAPPPDPPEGTFLLACALVPPRPPRRAELARFRLARLLFDSAEPQAAFGLRGAVELRQQIWRTPVADVDVRLDPGGLGAEPILLGQVLARRGTFPARAKGTVWVFERGRRPVWTDLRSGGEFTLAAPRSRRWSMLIACGAVRIRLDSP